MMNVRIDKVLFSDVDDLPQRELKWLHVLLKDALPWSANVGGGVGGSCLRF